MPGSFRRSILKTKLLIWAWLSLLAAVGLLPAGTILAAPEGADERPKAEEESEAQQAARKLVEAIKVTVVMGENHQEAELHKQPLLRYGDIARDNDRGSVWLWQRSGRPLAVMELYRGADSRSWVHVIHSLSADAIDADFGKPFPHWTPAREGIQWKELSAAPEPAERPTARARQIKELAQRFTAHEFWDPNNSRYELRLLVQPVHKYSAPDSGLLDGALFLLCHGTNPEVALLLEVVQEAGTAKYRYALARLGHAELHVAFDEREVWRQERVAKTSPQDAYWLLFRGVNPSSGQP